MPSSPSAVPRLDVHSAQGNKIVEAAMRCFDTWGVERTRMGDIALEAQIPRPTMYRYFPTKEALIVEVMVRHIRLENDRIRKLLKLTGPGRDVIKNCLMLQIRESRPKDLPGSLLRTEPMHKLARRSSTSPEVFEAMSELWSDILEYAKARGELKSDLDLDGAIHWLTVIVHMSLAIPELMPSDKELPHYLDAFVVGALVS